MPNYLFRLILLSSASVVGSAALAQQAPSQGSSGQASAPALGSSAQSIAPSSGSDSANAGEIIVTAQKRSQRLNDVPLAITAATGAQLADRGISQVADIGKLVPSFTFKPSYFGTPIYSIRGVGFIDTAAAASPAVSVYVDQVPLPFSILTEGASLDVERVEVLKGPQGTIFGENSTGGAINFIAAKPTSDFHAGGSVGYGRFNDVDVNAFVSGPLNDTLTARVAVDSDNRGNWQESQTRDAGLGKRRYGAGRLLLDWQPSDSLKFELNANGWYDKSDTEAAQFVSYFPSNPNGYTDQRAALLAYQPAPNNARVADWDPNTSLKRNDDFEQVSLRGDWKISDTLNLTSISAYSHFNELTPIDPDGTAVNNVFVTVNAKIVTESQELRLSGKLLRDALTWTLGGNYEHSKADDSQVGQEPGGTNNGLGVLRFSDFDEVNNQSITTKAVFGSLDYKVTDSVTASASARYTDVRDKFAGCLRDTGDGSLAAVFAQISAVAPLPGHCITLDANRVPVDPYFRDTLDQNNVSWKVGVSWKPVSGSLLYGNVTKGYKAQSYPTIAGLTTAQFSPARQESVLVYELGFKQSVFGRALQLNGSLFYYDYKNKQTAGFINSVFGNLTKLVNVPKSRLDGVELEAQSHPIRGLDLSAGVTYLDTKILSNFLTNDPYGVPVNIRGEPFANTPKWLASADAQYSFPVSGSMSGFIGSNVSYRSSTVAALAGLPSEAIPGYTLLDLRAGIEAPGQRWRVELYGRNITNKFYLTSVSHITDTFARIAGMPATYGVVLSFRY